MKRTTKLIKETGSYCTWTCDVLHTIRDGWTYKFIVHYEYDYTKWFVNSYYCKVTSLIDDEVIADWLYFHVEMLEDVILYHIDEIKARRLGITVEEYQNRKYPMSVTNWVLDDELPF